MQEKRGGGVSCRRRVWVTEEGIKRWGIRESLCEPLTASARPIEPKGKVTDAYLYMYGHIIAESMLHLRAFKKMVSSRLVLLLHACQSFWTMTGTFPGAHTLWPLWSRFGGVFDL